MYLGNLLRNLASEHIDNRTLPNGSDGTQFVRIIYSSAIDAVERLGIIEVGSLDKNQLMHMTEPNIEIGDEKIPDIQHAVRHAISQIQPPPIPIEKEPDLNRAVPLDWDAISKESAFKNWGL